ncbi:MAG: acyl-CoA dehydrogenase family protein [Ilumatobacteraceae bacterium]|nr:acyl-CoA dehydrogenase family protein [Ilumatobacteraceae bacterium]MBJ7368635.1 acyl-CoA dehydrogenase family protein [Ilumatobacteraceae bacterium]
MNYLPRTIYEAEHIEFRRTVRNWIESEIAPNHEQWERDGIVPRSVWEDAGMRGFLGIAVPEIYGGGGSEDFRFAAIISEEIGFAGVVGGAHGFTVHNDIVLPYILSLANDEQKMRWLPKMVSGKYIGALAITEPNTGSDMGAIKTTALLDGDEYIVNGSKTFISNGINSDVIVAAVRTSPDLGKKGISLLVIERGMSGFERGRNLEKIGKHSQDTAELFFNDMRVPASNLLGLEGDGMKYLMHNLAQERLSIAVDAVAVAVAALNWTQAYTKERTAFGQNLSQFQNTKFVMAELFAEVQIGQVYVDRCIELHNKKELDATQAAVAKFWLTEMQNKVVDRCLQLHGGYGYMREYPIARAWLDSRIQTIYGGTSEIMKEVISRSFDNQSQKVEH